jgi:RNA polymerase sigma factor (sigma-70 family)
MSLEEEHPSMNQLIDITNRLDVSFVLERSRLVRLCAKLTGDASVAEDLAQETMLEAWRHLNQLRDHEKFSAWLSGIARNVCLRWQRKHGHDAIHILPAIQVTSLDSHESDETSSLLELENMLPDTVDLEVELERKELILLLDRALALLPPETRTVLIERYVEESPIAEVAAKLGINASAAAMRLQRGKIALRRILAKDFSQDIALYTQGKSSSTNGDQWEETSLWCNMCGQSRLKGRFIVEEGELWLTCPNCCTEPGDFMIHTHFPKLLKGIKGYKPALSRIYTWDQNYYLPNLLTLTVPCLVCGRPNRLLKGPSEHPSLTPWHRNRHGFFHQCDHCKNDAGLPNYNWESLEFMVLSLPEARRFEREHPRIRQLPQLEVETDGRAAIVTAFESVTNSDKFAVISSLDTYETLRIE